ncbi:MAG: glycosyltransferase family 4 protein [Sediminibacterium sp.]|nr:MAG: hypothetical protein FD183_221 [Chitinophagaceae bacterium]MDP1842877.1 glycosyltransferase family 4 protein [Sediminibacterium sp.]
MVAKTAFIYLTAFSRTGGIEQFNKNVMASLNQSNIPSSIFSVHDTDCNEQYTNATFFKGFSGNRVAFILACIANAKKLDRVLIGHINLAFAALIIKKINPRVHIILFAHGIEVWNQQKGSAAWLLNNAHQILAVSNFTKNQLLANNPSVQEQKIQILPNSLDPFFKYPTNFTKPTYLQERYGIEPTDKLMLTIARLSSNEKYKGYDLVIKVLAQLNQSIQSTEAATSIKYMIVGKADPVELNRIKQLIEKEQLTDKVTLTGFVDDKELIDHYLLADLFVLPSLGEGFGIVLIEALACGLKVIAGNKDGSVDALLNGTLGTLLDPNDSMNLFNGLSLSLRSDITNKLNIQKETMANFKFEVFRKKIADLLETNNLG